MTESNLETSDSVVIRVFASFCRCVAFRLLARCEHGHDTAGCMKSGEWVEQMSSYQLLNKNIFTCRHQVEGYFIKF
jgi:hypothetical protein